jgi:hypothetical protein
VKTQLEKSSLRSADKIDAWNNSSNNLIELCVHRNINIRTSHKTQALAMASEPAKRTWVEFFFLFILFFLFLSFYFPFSSFFPFFFLLFFSFSNFFFLLIFYFPFYSFFLFYLFFFFLLFNFFLFIFSSF